MRGAQRIVFTSGADTYVLVWTPLASAYADRVERLGLWLAKHPEHTVTVESSEGK